MLRNPSTCYAEDVTGDGIDEIIFDQYSGGHVGSTYIHIFDIPSLPPEVMPFAPAGDKNLTIWNGWIHDSPEVSGKKQIQIGVPLGFCEEHGLSSYQWNGAWFELSHGWVDFGQASYSDDDALFNCSGRIMEYARDLNHQDAISVFESAYKTYYPKIKDNFEMLEEFRLMQGLSSAYHGDQETVISIFAEIVNSPTIPDSAWIQPAQEFLEAYQSPTDLYQACSRVNICAPYVAQYSDEECVHRDLCDYQAALEASVATAFSTSALRQITNDLKLAGIRIPSEGKYDFDGDSRDELWFTVLHPGETEYELWIAAEYSQGVKVFLVADKLPKQTIKFEIVERDGLNIKTDFGFDQTIELVRHPISGEPFVVVQYVDEFNLERQVLVQFIELRQLLMEGNAVTPIYERLLEIERKSPDCPFEIQDEYGGIIQIYNCANYSHTLALAAELAGKDIEAVRRFYDVWSAYPESPFALLARLKLELRDR
jgi:hypothetical protein